MTHLIIQILQKRLNVQTVIKYSSWTTTLQGKLTKSICLVLHAVTVTSTCLVRMKWLESIIRCAPLPVMAKTKKLDSVFFIVDLRPRGPHILRH